MKRIFRLLMGFLCLFATSCNSEEPETPYSGPWIISYMESFNWIRNTSSAFHEWFDEHSDDFDSASLEMSNGTLWNWQGDYILWTDYDKAIRGNVQWIEIVDNSTEDEIINKVEQFKSFTIEDIKDSAYDRFDAVYHKYDGK